MQKNKFNRLQRRRREVLYLKLKAMAELMDLTYQYLGRLENGVQPIPYHLIPKFAKHYQLTPQEVQECILEMAQEQHEQSPFPV